MPSEYFPDEGLVRGYRCPQCGSTEVVCTAAVYEFTTLVCQACQFTDTMDDWQIVAWFDRGKAP